MVLCPVGDSAIPEELFSNFPKIGSWQFFAGRIVGGLLLWAFAWFTLFRK